jgi:hypothetical protein
VLSVEYGCGRLQPGRETHDRDVKVIQIPPTLGFRLHNVDLFEGKRSLVPDIGQDGPRLRAQSTALAREQGDPTGLQKPAGGTHDCICK